MNNFTIDELYAWVINHEHGMSISNTSLEGACTTQPSISHGRGRGGSNSRVRGIFFSRVWCNNSPTNFARRGLNKNSSKESGHRFDK